MGTATIIAVVSDIMFRSRIEEGVSALGYDCLVADEAASVIEALSGNAALALIDLHAEGIDWRETAALAREAGLAVLAFGRHTEAQLLRDARAAGCDLVVPRSQLVEELPALIERMLSQVASG
jgi:DNA-binding NarL/FixJ family response regulator